MAKKKKKTGSFTNAAVSTFFLVLAGIAIREQLSLPQAERTWQGRILGMPYDFRMPTLERLQAALWNKKSAQIFVPTVFGIGWTVNLYPFIHPQPARTLM